MVDEFDEFGYLKQKAIDWDIPLEGPPVVRREKVTVSPGVELSAIVWGEGDPLAFLIHGGTHEAHDWDLFAMAIGAPVVAVDLPGHGQSDGKKSGPHVGAQKFWGSVLAEVEPLAEVMRKLAPNARAVCGQSRGGLVTGALARAHLELVRHAVLIDNTPAIVSRLGPGTDGPPMPEGPDSFKSIDEMVDTLRPTERVATIEQHRFDIRNNARQLVDGTWTWIHDRRPRDHDGRLVPGYKDAQDWESATEDPWSSLEGAKCPITLVIAGEFTHVTDEDVADFRSRFPDAVIHVVPGADHFLQTTHPKELADIVRPILAG